MHGPGGYKRTDLRSRGWNQQPLPGGRYSVARVLGNNQPGAEWVYDGEKQQPFHFASGWANTEDVVRDEEARINQAFNLEIRRRLRL